MSIKLTREQTEKVYRAFKAATGGNEGYFSAAANALVEMGVLVEPTPQRTSSAPVWEVTPPAPGPTIEERLAALESRVSGTLMDIELDLKAIWVELGKMVTTPSALEPKANRPASEALFTCPTVTEMERRGRIAGEAEGLVSWNDMTHSSRAAYCRMAIAVREAVLRPKQPEPMEMSSDHSPSAAAEAKAVLQEFVPKPDPKPTSSLIEECAEAAFRCSWPEVPWSEVEDDVKQDVIDSTSAAITRFLEEPASEADFESCYDAFMADCGNNRQGVRVAVGRFRRILLERVKGGA